MPTYVAQEKMRKILEDSSSNQVAKLIYEQLSFFIDAIVNALGEAEDGVVQMKPIDTSRQKVIDTMKEQNKTDLVKDFESYAQKAVQLVQKVIDAIDQALEKASYEDLEDLDFYFLTSSSVPLLEEELDQHLQSFEV